MIIDQQTGINIKNVLHDRFVHNNYWNHHFLISIHSRTVRFVMCYKPMVKINLYLSMTKNGFWFYRINGHLIARPGTMQPFIQMIIEGRCKDINIRVSLEAFTF